MPIYNIDFNILREGVGLQIPYAWNSDADPRVLKKSYSALTSPMRWRPRETVGDCLESCWRRALGRAGDRITNVLCMSASNQT
jgi:hypothetical protein